MYAVSPAEALTPVGGSPFPTGGNPTGLAFSPDGRRLATANSSAATISVFSVSSAGTLKELAGARLITDSGPSSIAFSPDGGLLASTNASDDTVSLFAYDVPAVAIGWPRDHQRYEVGASVPTRFSCAGSVFSPSVSACTDSHGGAGATGQLDTSAIGSWAYSVTATTADGQTATRTNRYTVGPHTYTEVAGSPAATGISPLAVAFSPLGGIVGTANAGDGTVSLFAVTPRGALTELPGSPFAVGNTPESIAFSADGRYLATGTGNGYDNAVRVFSISPTGLHPLAGSPFATGTSPATVAFSSQGLLATANRDSDNVSLFSISPTGTVTPVAGSPFAVGLTPRGVTFSPDGGLLATANSGDNSVSVFSVSPSGALSALPASPVAVGAFPWGIAFDPDGHRLAVGNYFDSTISMISVSPSGALSTVAGSPFPQGRSVESVAFNTSGRLLASGAIWNKAISLLSVSATGALTPATGAPLVAGDAVYSVAFDPRGGLLASVGQQDDSLSIYALDAPVAGIAEPAEDQTYALGQAIPTRYACSDAAEAPGITTCADSTGGSGTSGTLDTSTAGAHSYTVSATSGDGQITTRSIGYTVLGMPAARITEPAADGVYTLDQVVATGFGCSAIDVETAVGSCVDSNGASARHGTLDTSTLGAHTYSVTATNGAGRTATSTVAYTVNTPPAGQAPFATPVAPSHAFSIAKLTLASALGRVSFSLKLPGPGRITVIETASSSPARRPGAGSRRGGPRQGPIRVRHGAAHGVERGRRVDPGHPDATRARASPSAPQGARQPLRHVHADRWRGAHRPPPRPRGLADLSQTHDTGWITRSLGPRGLHRLRREDSNLELSPSPTAWLSVKRVVEPKGRSVDVRGWPGSAG